MKPTPKQEAFLTAALAEESTRTPLTPAQFHRAADGAHVSNTEENRARFLTRLFYAGLVEIRVAEVEE